LLRKTCHLSFLTFSTCPKQNNFFFEKKKKKNLQEKVGRLVAVEMSLEIKESDDVDGQVLATTLMTGDAVIEIVENDFDELDENDAR
jgi:UDP-N-acetylglucosamine pyrophosphorylase